jgi:hypothetical protein
MSERVGVAMAWGFFVGTIVGAALATAVLYFLLP